MPVGIGPGRGARDGAGAVPVAHPDGDGHRQRFPFALGDGLGLPHGVRVGFSERLPVRLTQPVGLAVPQRLALGEPERIT